MNPPAHHSAPTPPASAWREDAVTLPRSSRPMRPLLVVTLLLKAVAVGLWCFTPWRWTAVTVFFAPGCVVLYHLLTPEAQGLVRVFTRFATPRNEVWLTIDDGPDPEDTPQILELLDRHDARATFFVTGERAARWPELVREIIRRGHEVAHHTHTHPLLTFWCATPARLGAELDRPLEALRAAGVRPRWFRPPVGIKHLLLEPALAARGLHCVGWSIRSGDCLARDPATVVARVLRQLQPGAIVLMHESESVPRAVRVTALAGLLAALAARNYSCVVPEPDQLR